MNKTELEKNITYFEKTGKTSEELNSLRSEIFNSLDAGEIRTDTKNNLLKELYKIATLKNIFFLRVIERKPGLPKDEAAELKRLEVEEEESYESYEEEESYESSYT